MRGRCIVMPCVRRSTWVVEGLTYHLGLAEGMLDWLMEPRTLVVDVVCDGVLACGDDGG